MAGEALGPDRELREAIEAFDQGLAEGRFEDLARIFAEDARVLVHQEPPLEGIDAIRDAFSALFQRFDTSDYEPRYEIVDVHGDRGYVLGSFDETLRSRDGGAGIRVHGRVVQFWHRGRDGWRITILLTGRSAPDEQT